MKDFFKIWFPIIFFISAVFWLSAQFIKPAPTKELTITDGIEELKNLQMEIKEQVDVPLAYMNEYYQLKSHVDFVLKKMLGK